MAKKEARKAREAEERRVSGVPIKAPPSTAAAPGGTSPKVAKRTLRAARANPATGGGEGGGSPQT